MAKQTETGKAFEYALLSEFYNRLKDVTQVVIVDNGAYQTTKKCFESLNQEEKNSFAISASFAVNYLIDLEPRLNHGIGAMDVLELEIATDSRGQKGDVRDVILVRALQKWEIGISAKNNHRALKHSRLSGVLDFGDSWVGMPCSETYFNEVNKVFGRLAAIRKEDRTAKWDIIGDKNKEVYIPILEAFRKEVLLLQEKIPDTFAQDLVLYLIGNRDFYKVMNSKEGIEIQAFNLHGSLNQALKKIKPKAKINKVNLPTRIIELNFKKGSSNTLIAYFDEGWQISFRIHSASSKIESSLKFDINLVSNPYSLFVTRLLIKK